MEYEVVSKINIAEGKNAVTIGEFVYEPKIDGLSFTGKYPVPVQLRISEGLTKIEVTPTFLKLPFILRGWINLDILMREIDLMKLALCDKLLLHASCVDHTLIVGFPNSGKTYQTYKSVAAGAKLISEEYTIIDKGVAVPYRKMARSCLSARTIRDCNMPMTARENIELALRTARAAIMPFMFEAAIWKEIPVSGDTAKVKCIKYGSTGADLKSYKQLIILTENEFPFMSDYFIQAYALSSGLDVIEIQDRQRDMIKTFVRKVYA